MNKFPNTADGIKGLQEYLYAMDDKQLHKEANLLADDWLSWTAGRIELEVRLLERLREAPEALRQQLGWSLAACLLGRRPFTIACSDTKGGRLSFSVTLENRGDYQYSGSMAIWLD